MPRRSIFWRLRRSIFWRLRRSVFWRLRRGDIVLAALLTPVLLAATAGGHWHGHRPAGVAGYLLVAAAGAGLAWRRAAPTAALLWVFAGAMTYSALGYAGGPIYVALIIAFVTAVWHGDRRVAYAVLAAGFAVSAYLTPLLTEGRIGSLTSQAALAGWLLALAALPELARVAGRARVEQARRRAGEERLRMAQDLHDVLAHQLALITVQANAGLAMLHRQPDRAGESLQAIKQAGNSALGELRGVLDMLRTGEFSGGFGPAAAGGQASRVVPPGTSRVGAAPRRPTPLLSRAADTQALIDGARAAGLTVRYDDGGLDRPLPATADAAAYRVVQEGLTNAVRHAGPGSAVVVAADCADGTLTVEVADDGRGAAPQATLPAAGRGGRGLAGMAERVGALGGTLEAGPRPGGGFVIMARIPLGGQS
jgi:signal transduction histidine kinase